jgi:hypothetical protein
MNFELFIQLRDSWFGILDAEYQVERLEEEFQSNHGFVSQLKLARDLLEGMIEEEDQKLRRRIKRKYIRIGDLKQALDHVIKVRCFLEETLHLIEWEYVKWGLDRLKKAEAMMRIVMEEQVIQIKENWSKERKEKKNKKTKEDFDLLNLRWMRVQEKFRAMGHPDWIPEEKKKKKTGIIGKIKRWWNNGRK